MDREFHIRPMRRPDLDLPLDWAAAEGWNPGLYDGDAFHLADPRGFLLGLLDGEPVGCISAVSYGPEFGFLGFYIVRPDQRGRGFGMHLWLAALERLTGTQAIGLDGVLAQQDNYRRSGFALAYRNQRFEGTGKAGTAPGALPAGARLVDAAEVAADALLAYDTGIFGAARAAFLHAWVRPPAGSALALLDGGGGVTGYGVIRACRHGYKVGPLFADTPAGADTLFAALMATAPGAPVFLDVAQPNAEALALAARHGMTPVFETARMYLGATPAVDVGRTFGVTSFELG